MFRRQMKPPWSSACRPVPPKESMTTGPASCLRPGVQAQPPPSVQVQPALVPKSCHRSAPSPCFSGTSQPSHRGAAAAPPSCSPDRETRPPHSRA
ncbi:PREDICTED: atherin-like, partial [Chinchilla lanigera]|uniref:atherin-like n=1 Tax=Chinchilla lanigera TaxID=34839 RepID=UPI000695FD1A